MAHRRGLGTWGSRGDGHPGAERRLERQPVLLAEHGAEPFVDIIEAHAAAPGRPGKDTAHMSRVGAGAVVLDHDDGLRVSVGYKDRQTTRASLGSIP